MTMPRIVWQHVPDTVGRRRLRTRVRFGALAVTVLLVVGAWQALGVAAGLAAVGVMLVVTVLVEAWGRSTPETGAQRIWLDAGELCVEGPDVYRREAGEDAFECDDVDVDDEDVAGGSASDGDLDAGSDADHPMALPVVELGDIAWGTVYPATTRADGIAGPPVGFHLVVDLARSDGSRVCIVFDRRIPFRVRGEQALSEAVREVVGDRRWREPPAEDAFGEIDERRLADWTG
ncbi:MAG: hypothetical protein WD225_05530 [Ilumatobacteraceae bacterium]